jgi:hypothetical protein
MLEIIFSLARSFALSLSLSLLHLFRCFINNNNPCLYFIYTNIYIYIKTEETTASELYAKADSFEKSFNREVVLLRSDCIRHQHAIDK